MPNKEECPKKAKMVELIGITWNILVIMLSQSLIMHWGLYKPMQIIL